VADSWSITYELLSKNQNTSGKPRRKALLVLWPETLLKSHAAKIPQRRKKRGLGEISLLNLTKKTGMAIFDTKTKLFCKRSARSKDDRQAGRVTG
jgi:hypothetical protein